MSITHRVPFTLFVKIVLLPVLVLATLIAPLEIAGAEPLSEKISNLQSQIDGHKAEAERLHGQANTLQNALNAITAEKNAIQDSITLTQVKYDQLTAQIDETQAKLGKQQAVLAATVGELSVESATSPIEILAGSQSIGDFVDRQEYRKSVHDQIQVIVKEVSDLKKELASQRQEVETVLTRQKVHRDQLAAKENEQNKLLAATQAEEAKYQSLVADLERQKAEAEAALAASLGSGSYRSAPAGYVTPGTVVGAIGNTGLSSGPHLHLEVRSGGSVTNPAGYIVSQPVKPAVVSQSYGNADPIYASGYHPGTDYAAPTGTPIFAINSGNMYRGCSANLLGTDAYGYVAIVEHGNGAISIYAHMSGGPAACSYNTYY